MNASSLLYRFRISTDTERALQLLQQCIDEANPLPEKRRAQIRFEIRDLWRALTKERSQRKADYLSHPSFFSAYLRYFMPWNLVRLSALLTDLELCLPDNAVIIDVGAGPLTLLLALYSARPDLRSKPLTFLCLDRAPRIMEAGLQVFELLATRHGNAIPPWAIELRRNRFGETIAEKADLVCAVNVLNEFFWHHEGTLWDDASETYRQLCNYGKTKSSLLVVEPGEPRSGGLLSAIRAAAVLEGSRIIAPCPHTRACPMPGIFKSGQEHLIRESKQKRLGRKDQRDTAGWHAFLPLRMPAPRSKYPWCHFSVPADFAPRWLQELSAKAGLAKERLSFSYLLVSRGDSLNNSSSSPQGFAQSTRSGIKSMQPAAEPLFRIVSEPIRLPGGRLGRYACSSLGYVLLVPRGTEEVPASGALVRIKQPLAPLSPSTKKRHEGSGERIGRFGGRFRDGGRDHRLIQTYAKPNVPNFTEKLKEPKKIHLKSTELVDGSSVPEHAVDEKSGAFLISY